MGKSRDNTLAIDFGTSNSAVARYENGQVRRLQMEDGSDTLPTAIFFDFAQKKIHVGTKANACLTQGLEGRYMRSLKRALGTSLMGEKRYIMGLHLDFFDIISGFLRDLKTRAERIEGKEFPRVLSGRPVHFHNNNTAKDQQAQEDLRECYHRAGFRDVDFMFEPVAASLANNILRKGFSLGLIVDIGGGTSDYAIFRTLPDQPGHTPQIRASHGLRFGGTDFDKTLNGAYFMPVLGKGEQLRKVMSTGTTIAPVALFNDLATWEKIPFLYNPETLETARTLERDALNRAPFSRLITVLKYELGHELATLAEKAKITVNQTDARLEMIDLGLIEQGKTIKITRANLANIMTPHKEQIITGIRETLTLSDCKAQDITDVVFVGGSSLMTFVREAIEQLFPKATLHTSAVFTAVVDGLAIASTKSVTTQKI
ncbi:MAG: Hsp70 family protein [Paracoccaceae bacterium]